MSEKIGALWARETKNGMRYFSGNIETDGKKIKIIIWPTREKKSERSPDYTINVDTYQKPEAPQQQTPETRIPGTEFVDDIPF